MMIPATQIRVGTLVIHNGELHRVHDMIHKTPGNLRGFVQVKMRNLRNGSMAEQRFGSTDRVEKASLDEREMEYLYSDAAGHHFMDQQSYHRAAQHGHVEGLADAARDEGGDRFRLLQTCHSRNGTSGHGSAVHRGGHAGQDRHPGQQLPGEGLAFSCQLSALSLDCRLL